MRRSGRPGLNPLAGPFLLPVTPLHRGSEGGDGGRHGGCDCVITKATTDIMRIVASITTVVVGAIRITAQTLSDLSDSSEQVGVALRLTRHRGVQGGDGGGRADNEDGGHGRDDGSGICHRGLRNCDDSDDIGDGSNNCVLLQGFIFKRDMRRCPTFSNLKTLLLNEYWCVPDHFCSLACILQHSPVLKKLTLQLFSKMLSACDSVNNGLSPPHS
ncbi:hypothetical protein PR202_gb12651 [Eleusine coracana subsp. coracana]|uniref:Uncharacterized protein n=1 Tax=Eleusine coracana subsp. coracana TaxID=191504 RepID=A0AAV5ERI5_ELECO|nr:hypothetical protein PR202_gb12651 [Eleusine coracana subsp. coracana]